MIYNKKPTLTSNKINISLDILIKKKELTTSARY